MSISDAELKKIEENWEEFRKWCSELGDRSEAILKMLDHFEERAAMAPASSRIKFHNAIPGGLVDHSLRVLRNTIALCTAFKHKAPKESIIIASLFHDWGKAGSMDTDYYLPQTSDWHREKLGQMYEYNPKNTMSNAQLGLHTMSQFGIVLSEEEYLAILLNDGQYEDANKGYAMKEPALALIVHMADRWSSQCEKSRTSLLEPANPKF